MHQAGLHWDSLPYTALLVNSEWGQCVVVPILHCGYSHPPDSHYAQERAREVVSIELGIPALQYLANY